MQSDEIWDIASNLKSIMARPYHGLNNPDFNYDEKSLKQKTPISFYRYWGLLVVIIIIL